MNREQLSDVVSNIHSQGVDVVNFFQTEQGFSLLMVITGGVCTFLLTNFILPALVNGIVAVKNFVFGKPDKFKNRLIAALNDPEAQVMYDGNGRRYVSGPFCFDAVIMARGGWEMNNVRIPSNGQNLIQDLTKQDREYLSTLLAKAIERVEERNRKQRLRMASIEVDRFETACGKKSPA